ncbi:MAG TPA: hypothetical protein DDW30_03680, partial [Clostridiales bacterium]|nr:hypothetical protein [Clostridiales bacterium]
PLRELKGFRRVPLRVGERKTVTFEVGAHELMYYGKTGEPVLEAGEFEVFVGGDCLTDNGVTVRLL